MKFNWGFGIVLAFVAFISFIMYFVVVLSTNDKYNPDLVTEDYYKKELNYQQEIEAETRTITSGMSPEISRTDRGLLVSFPEKADISGISGTVFLYRPSNKQLDFEIPISLSQSHLLIPNKRLLDGRWNIEINWQYNGENYLTKKEIVY